MKEEQMDLPPGFVEMQEQHYGLPVQESDPILPPPHAQGSDWLYNFNRAIASVRAKHGAIDKDCKLSTEWMRKLTLIGICRILRELQERQLGELELSSLQAYYNILGDYEKLNIDVSWLVKRLNELKAAIVSRDATKTLTARKRGHLQKKKEKEERLKRLMIEVKEVKDQVALEELMVQELDREISHESSKFRRFETRTLVDGLI